ncbi:hypothetical protein EP232_03065 [bacterium]|nr:MAG: hypothetical protein EP232_03065 [bacterium]
MKRASWGGGGNGRIHFAPSTKLGMVSLPFDPALGGTQVRELVERSNHRWESHAKGVTADDKTARRDFFLVCQ